MEIIEVCDLCGSTRQKLFEVYVRHGETFNFVECLDCGLAFLNPRPDLKDLWRYYDKTYEDSRHGVYEESLFRRWAGPIVRWYLPIRYGRHPVVSFITQALFFPLEMVWRRYINLNQWMKNISYFGKILDVGCGRGGWLARMRYLGFDVYGCEPSSTAAAVAQSLDLSVKCCELSDANYPGNYFDVIHVHSVLEHVHNPTTVLLEIKRILKPEGVIIIDVPNHAGITGQAIRNSEDVPVHLYSYSPQTLRSYFDKVGLCAVSIITETRYPQTIYGYFGTHAMEMVRLSFPEKMVDAEQFWSFQNRKRNSEYRATARFFDSIGHGCHVVAIGTKNRNNP